MEKVIKFFAIIVFIVSLSNISIYAKSKNELVNRFAEVLKFKSHVAENPQTKPDTKITSLFIRSSGNNSIDLTMLITYDKRITDLTRKITNNKLTPLIFSVSTMPFTETDFDPSHFVFEQDGTSWTPDSNLDNPDIFPLGEDSTLGGRIDDTVIQKGVVLLPGTFDIRKPIKISYKNFKKVCRLL